MRPVRRVHQAIGDVHGDDGLGGERGEIRRRDNAGDVIGMVMREHDQARGVQRAGELGELLGVDTARACPG